MTISRWGFRGPECLACGGIKSAVKESGYTDEGLRIRRRRCADCGQFCTSVEVYINPELTTFSRLNGERLRRDRERRYRHDGKGLWRLPFRWVKPDRLRVRIELRRGSDREEAA